VLLWGELAVELVASLCGIAVLPAAPLDGFAVEFAEPVAFTSELGGVVLGVVAELDVVLEAPV
jgi:hypothetical protein